MAAVDSGQLNGWQYLDPIAPTRRKRLADTRDGVVVGQRQPTDARVCRQPYDLGRPQASVRVGRMRLEIEVWSVVVDV